MKFADTKRMCLKFIKHMKIEHKNAFEEEVISWVEGKDLFSYKLVKC